MANNSASADLSHTILISISLVLSVLDWPAPFHAKILFTNDLFLQTSKQFLYEGNFILKKIL